MNSRSAFNSLLCSARETASNCHFSFPDDDCLVMPIPRDHQFELFVKDGASRCFSFGWTSRASREDATCDGPIDDDAEPFTTGFHDDRRTHAGVAATGSAGPADLTCAARQQSRGHHPRRPNPQFLVDDPSARDPAQCRPAGTPRPRWVKSLFPGRASTSPPSTK
jgi:hypothetical protein